MSNKKMTPRCVSFKEDRMYILTDGIPYIFVIDLNTDNLVEKIECPRKERFDGHLFSGLYVEENKMVLIPRNAQNLWVFDFDTNDWTEIDFSQIINPSVECKFMGGALKNGVAYLYGYSYEGILAVDINSFSIRNIMEKDDLCGGLLGISSVTKGNEIFLPARSGEGIFRIECESEKCVYTNLGIADGIANDGIAYGNNSFYIYKNTGSVLYKVSENLTNIQELKLDNFFNKQRGEFEGIEFFNGRIVFYGPCDVGYIYDLDNKQDSFFTNESIYFAKVINDSELVVCKKGIIEILDTNMHVIKTYNLELCADEVESYYSHVNLDRKQYKENDMFGLEEMINYIVEAN